MAGETITVLDDEGVVLLATDIKTLADATYPANAAIASAYSSSATYAVGDFCLKGGLLYKCNTAIGTGGETWTAAHWTATNVVTEMGGGDTFSYDIISAEYSSSSEYSVGDYCLKDGTLYKCNTAIGSGGEAWNSAHWTATNVVTEMGGGDIFSYDIIGSEYDSSTSYIPGNYCLKDGTLYKCNTATGSSGETWDSTHWTATNVVGEITSVLTKLTFTNVVVASSAFVSDVTYNEFPYKASIALTNVTSSMLPEVVFSTADAISGIFSPVVESYNGGVYIYSSDIPSGASITIPSILCTVL